jgi:predicted transcriptional regulator
MEASYVLGDRWIQDSLTGQGGSLDDTEIRLLQLLDEEEPRDALELVSAGRLSPARAFLAIDRLLEAGLIVVVDEALQEWPRHRFRLDRDALRELLRPDAPSEAST